MLKRQSTLRRQSLGVALLMLVVTSACAKGRTEAARQSTQSEPPRRAADNPRPETAAVAATDAPVAQVAEPAKTVDNLQAAPPEEPGARVAMDRFLVALRTKDIAIFLSCFSKKRPFSLTSTARAKPLRSRFTYAQLAEGLRPEGDFVGVMFGDDNLDSIRDYATGAYDDGPWLPISSTKFAPSLFMPESNNAARIWVTWTKEGERWVIAEIAFPHE